MAHSTSLQDKVAIVTGAASGIGYATANRLAAAGAHVVFADLNEDGARKAAEASSHETPQNLAVGVDVTDAEALSRMVSLAEETFGHIDILSHNAGLARYPASALDAEPEEFDQIMTVNVKGAWLCARAVAPAMQRAGNGAIVLTGSVMGERTRSGFGAYAASKAAANHLARTLALEWAPTIRVNCVAPVATDTAMLPQFLGPDHPEQARKAFIAGIPLGRLAQPEDIAAAITFLASEEAGFITGVVLPVDGGRSI